MNGHVLNGLVAGMNFKQIESIIKRCLMSHISRIIELWRFLNVCFCRNGAEIVHCNGNYGHNYPFEHELEPYIGGTRILWNFMKSHRRIQPV